MFTSNTGANARGAPPPMPPPPSVNSSDPATAASTKAALDDATEQELQAAGKSRAATILSGTNGSQSGVDSPPLVSKKVLLGN